MRTSIAVADIFHAAGPAYRAARAGHLSLAELKVMSAIENCRTAALGGHVEGCDDCGHLRISYNSCRNRHCPRCQGAAAREWLAAALGVFGTGTGWPDIIVAAVMAILALQGAATVVRQATAELRKSDQPRGVPILR